MQSPSAVLNIGADVGKGAIVHLAAAYTAATRDRVWGDLATSTVAAKNLMRSNAPIERPYPKRPTASNSFASTFVCA